MSGSPTTCVCVERSCRSTHTAAITAVDVEQVALLHDIGKIGMPDAVWNKSGPLSENEWVAAKTHAPPASGSAFVGGLVHPALAMWAGHERWAGQGTDGLSGEREYPLPAVSSSAATPYHAMASGRAYRKAMNVQAALEELRKGADSQFCLLPYERLFAYSTGRSSDRYKAPVPGLGRGHQQPLRRRPHGYWLAGSW